MCLIKGLDAGLVRAPDQRSQKPPQAMGEVSSWIHCGQFLVSGCMIRSLNLVLHEKEREEMGPFWHSEAPDYSTVELTSLILLAAPHSLSNSHGNLYSELLVSSRGRSETLHMWKVVVFDVV